MLLPRESQSCRKLYLRIVRKIGTGSKVAGKDTETVINALIKNARKLPEELYQSLTWDRGKSRLMYEFDNWLELRPETIWLFRGRGDPQTAGQPYGLLRDLFAWRFQIQDSDSLDTAREKLRAGIAPVFGASGDEQTALLGQLLGFDYAASPHIAGILQDAGQIRDRAFHAAAQYFRRLSEGHGEPVVILLDDIHWADDGSLDFINYLAEVDHDR
jgi:hypothetical protein